MESVQQATVFANNKSYVHNAQRHSQKHSGWPKKSATKFETLLRISQGNAAKHLRCGGICNDHVNIKLLTYILTYILLQIC